MVVVMLMQIVGGIGLAQAVSDPHQVTLRWLRLGGMIAVGLLAVAATVSVMEDGPSPGLGSPLAWAYAATLLAFVVQLLTVQTGHRFAGRVSSAAAFVCVCWSVTLMIPAIMTPAAAWQSAAVSVGRPDQPADWLWASIVTVPVSAGLVGGFLMAMLLGHAYLTAGNEMTQSPFRRLVLFLAGLLVLRLLISGWFGARPSLAMPAAGGLAGMWTGMMILARYGVGLVVPGVFAYMIYDCVNRRANQSATGILYVATVLVILGEGMGFALLGSTGFAF